MLRIERGMTRKRRGITQKEIQSESFSAAICVQSAKSALDAERRERVAGNARLGNPRDANRDDRGRKPEGAQPYFCSGI